MLPKFLNRQNLIVGLMAVVILYGLYDFIFAARPANYAPRKSAMSLANINTLLADAGARDHLAVEGLYVIKRAEAEWMRNPFYEQKAYRAWFNAQNPVKTAEAKGAVKSTFNYTGYLELGTKKIAIINGIEYGVGEPLDIEGYVLKSISPSQVLLEKKADRRKFVVPLQE